MLDKFVKACDMMETVMTVMGAISFGWIGTKLGYKAFDWIANKLDIGR